MDILLAPTNHDMVCEVFGPEVMPNTSKIACAGFVRIIRVHAGGVRLRYRSSKSAVSMANHDCFARHMTVTLASDRYHAWHITLAGRITSKKAVCSGLPWPVCLRADAVQLTSGTSETEQRPCRTVNSDQDK